MRDPDRIAAAIRPALEDLERSRGELRDGTRRAWRNIAITFAVLVVLGGLAGLAAGAAQVAALVAAVVALVVAGVMYAVTISGPTGKFKTRFKREAVGAIVRAMEPRVAFAPGAGIAKEEFVRSGLFGARPDRYRVEDELSGEIGQTRLRLSEVHAEQRHTRVRKGRTETYYTTLFKGVFMIADFHKHFACTARVFPDTAEKLLGRFGKLMQGVRPFADEKLVYLEDPEFEREFVVYGTDQVEVRYILSTSMLRRILELKREWNSDVRLAFLDSRVYLAIAHSRDLFEPDLRRSAFAREQVRRIVRELSVCFDLVDDLNLNTRIWSKA